MREGVRRNRDAGSLQFKPSSCDPSSRLLFISESCRRANFSCFIRLAAPCSVALGAEERLGGINQSRLPIGNGFGFFFWPAQRLLGGEKGRLATMGETKVNRVNLDLADCSTGEGTKQRSVGSDLDLKATLSQARVPQSHTCARNVSLISKGEMRLSYATCPNDWISHQPVQIIQ
jgi:hypothetical protein